MFNHLFIQQAFDPSTRFFYFATVLSVVISITLHELAHGWTAVRLGDLTPMRLGHMTGNPLVHMSPYAIALLFVFGLTWGQMPIDPTRLKGKYAEAMVAFAGPLTNFLLSFVALTGLGLWWRFGTFGDSQLQHNVVAFVYKFGSINALLGVFNLIPVPPLDGSHILANFSRRFAAFMDDPRHHNLRLMAFIFVFSVSPVVLLPVYVFADVYTAILAGGMSWYDYMFHL